MQFKQLGNTDLQVSAICLGTMTFGEQNTEAEGHHQLDYAIEHGINFIDTAELYAIPPKKETYGLTETIIGRWLAKRGKRDDLVIASKIAGPGEDWVSHIRKGKTRFDMLNILLSYMLFLLKKRRTGSRKPLLDVGWLNEENEMIWLLPVK
jgi:aryl-alcohol dehydrogenase-like predicted oxidoreductase